MLDRRASRNVTEPIGESIEADAADVWPLPEGVHFSHVTTEEQHEIQPLLDELDTLNIDTKLIALIGWISKFWSREPGRPICIYSRFVATVRYLEIALREHHPEVLAVTGDLNAGEKRLRLESFQETRSILVTSLIALEGFEIHAGAVVFYDAVWSADSMAAALARVRCADEGKAYDVVVLRDGSDVLRGLDGDAAMSL
jgi:superfamily II DNA/RNA helicase